jgi:phosphoglycerate dehydrogenase-like enzyme
MKINNNDILAVCNRTLSTNKEVISIIKKNFKYYKLNLTGKTLKGSQLQNFLTNATLAIVGLEVINKKLLENLPKLKKIAKYGVGLDNIDQLSIKEKKIRFFYSKGFNKRSVAEFSLCLIIFLLRNIKKANDDFISNLTWLNIGGEEITNKTLGIIGCGNIGKELVKIIKPFNCKILTYDIKNYKNFNKRYNIKKKNINYVLKNSDIISLNLPLNDRTRNLIKLKYLKKLKKNSVFINTSRGGIVNEKDLYTFLSRNKSIIYGTDVLENEPPTFRKKLYKLNNFFTTPHMAGTTKQSIIRGASLCLQFLKKNNY